MMESVAAGAEELYCLGSRNLGSHDQIEGHRDWRRRTRSSGRQQAQRLTEAAQSMSGIVELIHNITGQINLLALNATIESARAGEAGRASRWWPPR